MKKAFFITGTDTGIGKTYSTVTLLNHYNQQHLKTTALKPIASGCHKTPKGLRNDDALQLQTAMSMDFTYDQVNPFAFEQAISPHLAAKPLTLDVNNTIHACQPILKSPYDILLIEGAGGWMSPLNDQQTFADLATGFGFPVILVVGLRLGCLNHALLTYKCIKESGLPFAGWIANHIDPNMNKQQENIETLIALLDEAPLLTIPHKPMAINI